MYCDYIHIQVLHSIPILVLLNPFFPPWTPVDTPLKELTPSSPAIDSSYKLLKERWSLTGNSYIHSKKPQGPNLLWISLVAVCSWLQQQCHSWLAAFHDTFLHLLALKFFQISLLLCSLYLGGLMQISHWVLSAHKSHILRTLISSALAVILCKSSFSILH